MDQNSFESVKPLRILVVADVLPWPARDGYRLRICQTIDAFAKEHSVDLYAAIREELYDVPLNDSTNITRQEVVRAPEKKRRLSLIIRALVSRTPRRILWRDWREAQAKLRDFVETEYDLVWYCHADAFSMLGDPKYGPAVVDLDNLEDRILDWRKSTSASQNFLTLDRPQSSKFATSLRKVLALREAYCWTRVQNRIIQSADLSVVCSELDRGRLGKSRVVVVPNGYHDPGPSEHLASTNTSLLMIGRFSYPPNLEAATWFVNEVLPILREMVPNVEVRFVGRHDGQLDALASSANVKVIGEVPDVETELRNARGAIIPILNGSGTRIKVLEAMAYAIPVITTPTGCEGLPIEDDQNALVAENAQGFADQCATLIKDDLLCQRIGEAGRELFLEKFSSSIVSQAIIDIATELAS